ncbi:MAG: hypothetical protein OEY14_18275 [Myxococcales bacterium]|nr:hypothetical protein [Myxococcales bacterium]
MLKWIISVIALVAMACIPRMSQGTFSEVGYHHDRFSFGIAYPEGSQELLGCNWRLRNFTRTRRGRWQRIDRPEARAHYALDDDGDGRPEHRATMPRAEIELENVLTQALIWIRLEPLSGWERGRELRTFTRDLREALSGSVRVGRVALPGHLQMVFEREVTTEIRQQNDAVVLGYPAHAATLEVADVERLRLSPDSREWLVRAIFVATPFTIPGRGRSEAVSYPILMRVIYAARPEDFDRHLPEFERFVHQLRMPEGPEGPTRGVVPNVDQGLPLGAFLPPRNPEEPAEPAEPRPLPPPPALSEPAEGSDALPGPALPPPS